MISRRMATAQPLPAPATDAAAQAEAAWRGHCADDRPLRSCRSPAGRRDDVLIATRMPRAARLPVELDVAVPVSEFRVRNLLALAARRR